MIDSESIDYFATYSRFSISNELEKYRLTLGQYSGTAGKKELSFTLMGVFGGDFRVQPTNESIPVIKT